MMAITIATAIVIGAEIWSPCCCQKLWSTDDLFAHPRAGSRENARMKSRRTRAVLLDALGTLVELEPPWVSPARSSAQSPTSASWRRAR